MKPILKVIDAIPRLSPPARGRGLKLLTACKLTCRLDCRPPRGGVD